MNLLNKLNQPQKQAVLADKGPFLVIAGAGSGKTTALTQRISYLIKERNISPFNILAVTFTNKAADEMRERVLQSLQGKSSMPLIGTFHSICVRILREEIAQLGYGKDFSIADQQDQLIMIKKVLKELELPTQQFAPKAVAGSISRAKNNLLSPKNLLKQVGDHYEEQLSYVYDRYQKYLKDNNSLDFDDLLRLTILLFEKDQAVLKQYQDRFQYILVDEYQDTNYAQYKLIKLLAEKNQNIFVVGDDWQSIYRWRGADVSNILNFKKDYPKAQIIKLEQNYRSTQIILDAAHHIIKSNNSRSKKEIWTDKVGGKNITIFEARSEQEEAQFIAQTIQKLISGGEYSLNDFVILYRTNAQSRVIEEYLLKESISYRIVGGIKFYQRKEVKNLIAYLRLIANHQDIISLERALGSPRRGIGGKTLDQWLGGAKSFKMTPIEFGLGAEIKTIIKAKSRQKTIFNFCQLIKNLTGQLEKLKLTQFIEEVYKKSGYQKYLLDGSIEGDTRNENVQELFSVAGKYDDIENALQIFLEEVALVSDTDTIDQGVEMAHLMTLHSAKGLEFPVVFIIGVEEGLVPHSRALNSEEEMEEERRLIYVGITRAKEQVYLVSAKQRILFGSFKTNLPSRFLDDIPNELVEIFSSKNQITQKTIQKSASRNFQKNKSNNQKQVKQFSDGAKVSHEKFGSGVVVSQDDNTISVVFKTNGLKKLAKDFAKLK